MGRRYPKGTKRETTTFVEQPKQQALWRMMQGGLQEFATRMVKDLAGELLEEENRTFAVSATVTTLSNKHAVMTPNPEAFWLRVRSCRFPVLA